MVGGQTSCGGQEQGLLRHESQLGSVPHPAPLGRWIHTCEAQLPVKLGLMLAPPSKSIVRI